LVVFVASALWLVAVLWVLPGRGMGFFEKMRSNTGMGMK